jgi:energy-coupling factor transporter transmembrane protein EcfT
MSVQRTQRSGMSTPLAPLSIGLVAVGVSVAAFAADDPFVIAAGLLTSALLLARSSGPRRLFATIAITTGLAVAILNPFVSTQGDLILIDGPTSLFLDLQVTLEELLYGLAAGARLAAVTLLTGAFLALVDRDRLAARAALVAPRSALTVALAARLLPALRRDAVTLHEAARLRGWRTGAGRREALRTWGGLLEPMCAAALERGGEHAEAMAARGYGAGRATALPERSLTRRERTLAVVGGGTVAVAGWTLVGAGDFHWYPTLGSSTLPALVAAATLAVLGIAAALLVGARR